jgi:hypothetical protein
MKFFFMYYRQPSFNAGRFNDKGLIAKRLPHCRNIPGGSETAGMVTAVGKVGPCYREPRISRLEQNRFLVRSSARHDTQPGHRYRNVEIP